ncbi:MAG: trypsin-like peptidase domain-containing protein [Prevotellaceae bacterium]|nr:trypsin-like peptidase domain-containing protein [Prevotellaceae bacterium]
MKSKSILQISTLVIVPFLLFACKKDKKQIFEDAKQATVTIYTFDEYGAPAGNASGFFIDKNGTGITNYHVLHKSVKAIVKTADNQEFEIDSVLVSDRKKDIIKFKVKNPNNKKFKYLTFSKTEINQGDAIYNVSSPLGLEQTVSEGIISAIRSDSHGDIIQVSAPISEGSSGSAILNQDGDVIAVSTYTYKKGQNLNFGVKLDEEILGSITSNDFDKSNKKFNSKDNYVIINSRSTNNPSVILHALEFKKDATIAYLSYTNLDISEGEKTYIWVNLNKKDNGFYLLDLNTDKKYYIVSSTIGDSRENGTEVPLASSYRFKLTFPPIKKPSELETIDIVEGKSKKGWKFEDINLSDYRTALLYDEESYNKNYGYLCMHDGDLDNASYVFLSILEDNPEDEEALNALGIIALVEGNNKDALDYFTEAVEQHPNSVTGLKNRAAYYSLQEDYNEALKDLNHVVSIEGNNPENYLLRYSLYSKMEKWNLAIKDLNEVLKSSDYSEDGNIYYLRAYLYALTQNWKNANEDLRTAYKYADNKELEKMITELYQAIP